jgi:hypothetical protein
MAPSITIGAVILLWRRAATKVIVSHAPSRNGADHPAPLGARPLSRAKLVLTAVSSINTSRAGSSMFVFLDVHRPWRKVKVTESRAAADFAACMRELTDAHFPKAERIRVVLDNLSTHSAGALYQAFPAEKAFEKIVAILSTQFRVKTTYLSGQQPIMTGFESCNWAPDGVA